VGSLAPFHAIAVDKDRFIDVTLVYANGTIDIVEIKKPFANCLLSRNKYRDNYTPRKRPARKFAQRLPTEEFEVHPRARFRPDDVRVFVRSVLG
jgi:hypothetical protein